MYIQKQEVFLAVKERERKDNSNKNDAFFPSFSVIDKDEKKIPIKRKREKMMTKR
jgi:hypothetical protein